MKSAKATEKVKWVLKEIPIKSLKEHSKNPRQIHKEKFERLGNLIEKFGLIDKPIINKDMTIIGGHQRIRYLKNKKEKTVECWLSDRNLTDKEIDELCIGLNLHQGAWDWDVMANQWNSIDLLEFGFTEEQLLGEFTKKADQILDQQKEQQEKIKKSKECPNCGHEF